MLDSEESPFGKSTFNRNRQIERRRTSVASGWEPPRGQKKKRGRPLMTGEEEAVAATGTVIGHSSRRGTKADNTMTTTSRRGIQVGDADAVWDFYQERFKNCQQTACKLIAKAWVKAVEPKKQSTHPYTGSDEKAPEWWPKPWGPTKDDKVRHKEPDHLYKRGMGFRNCLGVQRRVDTNTMQSESTFLPTSCAWLWNPTASNTPTSASWASTLPS